MIELALAVAAAVVALSVMWWRDARRHSGWDDLLAADSHQTRAMLTAKFRAEERVATLSGDRGFMVALVPGRLQILQRLAVYERLVAAAAPPPERLGVRLRFLRRAFVAFAGTGVASAESLAALDRDALESCRLLAAAVDDIGR